MYRQVRKEKCIQIIRKKMVKNQEDLGLDRNIDEQIPKTYGVRHRLHLFGSAHRPI